MSTEKIIESIITGTIGSVGGIAYYLYRISNGERFRGSLFLINAFLSFFIASVAGEFIPEEMKYKYGLIGFVGFFALEIIKLAEKKLPFLFDRFIDSKTK